MVENIIITYGGGEALHYIFNGIAMILSLEQGIANNLLHLVGVIGTLWTVTLMYIRSSVQVGLMWFGWFLLATTLLFGPRSSLIIKDELLPIKTYKVDNVPLALAIVSSTISNFSNVFIKKMESVFTLPDYLPYHQHGSVFASKILAKAREFRIVDPTFNSNMERFVLQCVVYDAMIGAKYSLKDLKTTEDIWELVSSKPSKILGFLYKDNKANPPINSIVTCSKGAELLKNEWNNQIQLAAQKYGQLFFANKKFTTKYHNNPNALSREEKLAKETFLVNLPMSYSLLTGISQDASKILQQEMMINALRSAAHSKAVQYGQAYTNAKMHLQQKGAMQAAGMMAYDFLPMLKTVFECILYAAFIFIWILGPLPGGYTLVGLYFRELMWVQSWPILFAVLNLLCTVWSQHKTAGILDGYGLNHINSLALSDVNETMQAIAGWLSLSVPVLSRVIVTGTLQGLNSLSGYLASSVQGVAGGAASELVSGNIQLGNVQYDTTSVHQLSGFKTDRNMMHHSGQYMRNSERGALITNNPHNTVYQGGEGRTSSVFNTGISSSSHISQQLNEHADRETSLAQGDAVEYGKNLQAAHRDAADLLTRVYRGDSENQVLGKDQSSSKAKSLNKVNDFAEVLQKKYGITDHEAFTLALGVAAHGGAGADKGFLNLGIKVDASGNYVTSSGKTIDQGAITDLAKRENYSESLDHIVRSFNNLQFNKHQGEEKSLAESIVDSYEKAEHYRDSHSVHLNNAQRYSEAASKIQGSSLDHKTSESDALADFIANTRGTSGRGRNGQEYARKVLDAGPQNKVLFQLQQEYVQAYKEHRAESLVNYINDKFKNNEAIKQEYETLQNQQSHARHEDELNKQADKYKQDTQSKAVNKHSLDKETMPGNLLYETQRMESLVDYNLMEAEIEQRNQEESLQGRTKNMQTEINAQYNKNVVVKETVKDVKKAVDLAIKMGEKIREAHGEDFVQ